MDSHGHPSSRLSTCGWHSLIQYWASLLTPNPGVRESVVLGSVQASVGTFGSLAYSYIFLRLCLSCEKRQVSLQTIPSCLK